MHVEQLFRATLDHGTVRVWTGAVALEDFEEPFGVPSTEPGETVDYLPGLGFSGVIDGQVRFTMGGELLRGAYPTPLGGRGVTLFYVGSETGGPPWRRIPFVTQGILDSPRLYAGAFSVAVVPPRYDAPVERWSAEEHQADHPGDTFFSQMKALSRGLQGVWWPNVPRYNRREQYDIRRIPGKGAPGVETAGAPLGTPGVRQVGGQAVPLTVAPAPGRPGR